MLKNGKLVYVNTDATLHIHCFGMHVSQFLSLQQGLEMLNDTMTIYFQHSSNHWEKDALSESALTNPQVNCGMTLQLCIHNMYYIKQCILPYYTHASCCIVPSQYEH